MDISGRFLTVILGVCGVLEGEVFLRDSAGLLWGQRAETDMLLTRKGRSQEKINNN